MHHVRQTVCHVDQYLVTTQLAALVVLMQPLVTAGNNSNNTTSLLLLSADRGVLLIPCIPMCVASASEIIVPFSAGWLLDRYIVNCWSFPMRNSLLCGLVLNGGTRWLALYFVKFHDEPPLMTVVLSCCRNCCIHPD